MAYTQDELLSVENAIARGYLTVRHSDGKQVTYRSISELKEARDLIKKSMANESGTSSVRKRAFVARTSKGL